jgi:hypothetical protein
MATYEPQHISARNLLLSANSQSNYGVAVPDANLLERARFDGNAFASINPSFWSDGELAGRGHEFPTERPLIMWETGMQMSRHVDDWLAGWMVAQVLQGYSVSGAGPYIHVFKPLSATRQAKPTTVYFEDSAVIKYRLLDLVGTELTITIPETGPVTMQISLQGSGRFTDGVLGNALPVLAARTLLLGSDADFLIGASGAAASVKNRWRASAQIKITREIEIHRAPGGGLYALQANVDKQRAGFTIMLRAKDTEDAAEPRSLMIANTLREVQLNVNSGAAAKLFTKFPNTYIRTTPNMDGRYLSWQIDGGDQELVKPIGSASEIVEVTVTNSQATYLVGA